MAVGSTLNILQIILFGVFSSYSHASEQCVKWFEKSGIKQGPNCVFECAMKTNDMASFHCSVECEELCNVQVKQSFVIMLSKLYPGLTDAEQALAVRDPEKTLKAYKLSWRAESLCNEIYTRSRHNDESDACRHFVWSALLLHDLGNDFANEILMAHEQDPEQPVEEKEMDQANNNLGLAMAKRLKLDRKLSESSVMEGFKELLKNNKMRVLRSRYPQGGKK